MIFQLVGLALSVVGTILVAYSFKVEERGAEFLTRNDIKESWERSLPVKYSALRFKLGIWAIVLGFTLQFVGLILNSNST
jgi:uncharacterized membrane protein